MARIASGGNAYCYRHFLYDVINKRYLASLGRLPVENAERFAESLNNTVFNDISAFTACFAFVFLYISLYKQADHISLKLYSFYTGAQKKVTK